MIPKTVRSKILIYMVLFAAAGLLVGKTLQHLGSVQPGIVEVLTLFACAVLAFAINREVRFSIGPYAVMPWFVFAAIAVLMYFS